MSGESGDHRPTRRIILSAGAAGISSLALGNRPSPPSVMPKTLIPHPLLSGATVALVAPSGAVETIAEVDASVACLEGLGFKVVPSPHVTCRHGYLAGTDEERAGDLMASFLSPKIDGIWCIKGGYGAARVLPLLDYSLIRRNVKPMIGYSDITALHLALLARANILSFHGPVGMSEFTPYTVANLLPVIAGLGHQVDVPSGAERMVAIREGSRPKVTGRLIGGNLTVFQSLFGTRYMPNLKNAILFFEDIGEDPYRVDRMLTQLRLAGVLDHARAILFGSFTARKGQPAPAAGDWSMETILRDRTDDLSLPTLLHVPFGHISEKITIPQGGHATLTFDPIGLALTSS